MQKAKILVLGPCESGKTVISNFLSDATETSSGEYHPTQGCRILEFEVNNVYLGSRNITAEVELWDVSGDQKFESCWPAIARDTNGIIFVYNPDKANHDKELETWYEYFVDRVGLRNEQCIVFANQKGERPSRDDTELTASMKKIQVVSTDIDSEGDACRDEFSTYLGNLLTTMSDKREQEELSIINR